MKIETERLILRHYKETDWKSVHEYASLPDFSQYEMWGPNSIEDTKKFIFDAVKKSKADPKFQFEFAVCLKENNQHIGGCDIRRSTQHSNVADMGWAMNPKFQSKGYITEAGAALIDFGFSKLNLAVIYATCDTRNTASFRVMEKLNMKRVGHTIGDRKIDCQIYNSYRYEITNKRELCQQ